MKRKKSPNLGRKGTSVGNNETGSSGSASASGSAGTGTGTATGGAPSGPAPAPAPGGPSNLTPTTRQSTPPTTSTPAAASASPHPLASGGVPLGHQQAPAVRARTLPLSGASASGLLEEYRSCQDAISSSQHPQEPMGIHVPPNGSMDGNVNQSQSVLGSNNSRDDLDALIPSSSDAHRTRNVIEHIQAKINRTKEAIKAEQTLRDENVNEYLKLASNADKNQLTRIKSVFEKKNQKSAQSIAQLQKKLEIYFKRIKDVEAYGWQANHHRPKEMLRDMGQGLKGVGSNMWGISSGVIGGIKSGLSAATHTAGETVISKPKEFWKNRFGSADNIASVEKLGGEEGGPSEQQEGGDASRVYHGSSTLAQSQSRSHSTKYTSEDESSSITSGSGHVGVSGVPVLGASAGGSSASPARHLVSQAAHGHVTTVIPDKETAAMVDIEPVFAELRERRDECHRLAEDMELLKTNLQVECAAFHQSLQEERYRFERLEEQMNDLIELHQNEIENLKQGITDMEEKVQYQSEERLRDVHEMLESCQTRISRMEHQQHQHIQQLVNLDSLENTNARALVLKLINVVLTILQVILLLVATLANILTPFLQTRLRILTTILLLIVIMLLFQQWSDISSWVNDRFGDRLAMIYSFLPGDHG